MRVSFTVSSLAFAFGVFSGCAGPSSAPADSAQHPAAGPAARAGASSAAHAQATGADDALKLLMDGNRRFVAGAMHSHSGEGALRTKLATTQSPYAVIVSCSDSRVGPELVFDQDLGEIFVVRTAGEVLDDPCLGSIEYAVEHLHSPLIVVLGHERCGAVSAAVAGGEAPGHIGSLVKGIQPAVQATKGQAGDPIDNAVRENVRDVVHRLESSDPILSESVHAGHLRVVGAYYDLDTGEVTTVASAH